jgi:hypothetical protein
MPPEIGDFEAIPAVAAAAAARVGNELLFPFSKAFELVRLCSEHQIAVLGIELFAPRTEGAYQAMGFSDYDLRLKNNPERAEEWLDYVKANNTQAEQFLTQNRDNHLIVFTTASWMEFREIRNKSDARPQLRQKHPIEVMLSLDSLIHEAELVLRSLFRPREPRSGARLQPTAQAVGKNVQN